jgi:DnaJ-class molecular chaperone
MSKNYYEVLGVTSEATPDGIQSAYRRQLKAVHPDRYGRESASFFEVQEAYSVLGNSARRQTYDQSRRANCPSRWFRPVPAAGEPSEAESRPAPKTESCLCEASVARSFQTIGPSLEELLARLGSNFNFVAHPKSERLESLTIEIPLATEQAAHGGRARVLIPAQTTCPACQGHGHLGPYECWHCAGHGTMAGEYAVWITFPAGIRDPFFVQIPLDRFGIHNFYLTVCLRITAAALA